MSRPAFDPVRACSVLALALAAGAGHANAQCDAAWATHLPTARVDADAAFDTVRQRIVLFGGIDGSSYRADTWESDGIGWRLAATTGPSARRGHKLVYDSVNRRTLMMGGYLQSGGGAGPFQTWAWDGATWRLVDSAGPAYAFTSSAQLESAAAFDSARGRVVLFLANGQTWEYASTGAAAGWTLVSSAGPSARRGMAMTFDRQGRRVILFGGVSGTTRHADTWDWDGSAWRNLGLTGPGARSEARMVYDPGARRVLLFGGAGASGTRIRDTWSLTSGGGWVQLAATGPTNPSTGAGNTMVFDSVRQQAMLIGGSVAPWTDLCVMPAASPGAWASIEFGPSARTGAAIAHDSARRRTVLFGGLSGTRQSDTWEFDGGAWRRLSPATVPPPRTEHAMAYDPVRQRTVLFGGNNGSVNSETWEWDGVDWALRSTSGPSARDRAAMVYDPIRGGVLLHGGATSTGAGSNETWLWNGSTWTRIATGPTRYSHAMAYFPSMDRVILYGGSGAGVSQTAFAWDGAAWTAVGGTGPSPATEHTLTHDPDSSQLLLVGPNTTDAAVWTFDGTTWRRTPNAGGSPRGRTNHVAWIDQVRGRLLIYGGTTGSASLRETWEFRGVGGPRIASTPSWQVSCREGQASFTVQLAAGAAASNVTWLRNGFTVSPGPTAWGSRINALSSPDGLSHTLSIDGVTEADSGGYQCVLESVCTGGSGATVTNPATLRVCSADFNCSGSGAGDGVSEQDIFDFLSAWFAGDQRSDMNRDGELSVEDMFAFLSAFFAGC